MQRITAVEHALLLGALANFRRDLTTIGRDDQNQILKKYADSFGVQMSWIEVLQLVEDMDRRFQEAAAIVSI